MPRNSNGPGSGEGAAKRRDPKLIVRAILGTLLAANLIAAGMILFPPGGSAEALSRQMAALQTQLSAKRIALEQARQHAAAVAQGREEGDQFVAKYFLPVRTADITVESDLERAAAAAKIKPKGTQLSHEPIEGSDTLQMLSVTANYEGAYADVLKFVHTLDESPRLLIIESLSAVPQQGSNVLAVSLKIDAFIRGGSSEE